MRAVIITSLVCLLAQMPSAYASTLTDSIRSPDGNFWELLDENNKSLFLMGYDCGSEMSQFFVIGGLENWIRFYQGKGKSGKESASTLQGYLNLVNKFSRTNRFFPGVNASEYVKAIDDFYSDKSNIRIPISFALSYTNDRFQGKSSDDLSRTLNLLREQSNR